MMKELLMLIILLYFISFIPKYITYDKSEYKKRSGNSFVKTIFNKGNYGEFLTFSYLEKLPDYKKLLTNVYITKKDGKTTEIDLIMLHETGIYVFESKNYSGWIFGDEKNKTWTQTLNGNQKNKFFNPIWQNNTHINALSFILPELEHYIFKSYIIFSERCTLKKINIVSKDVQVINRQNLLKTINIDIKYSDKILSKEKLDELFYRHLLPLSLATDEIKKRHIQDILKKH